MSGTNYKLFFRHPRRPHPPLDRSRQFHFNQVNKSYTIYNVFRSVGLTLSNSEYVDLFPSKIECSCVCSNTMLQGENGVT